jgi:hypothetical protein
MRASPRTFLVALGAALVACGSPPPDGDPAGGDAPAVDTAASVPLDREALERVMGRSASAIAGGGLRFGMPRGDLAVSVDGIRVRPSLALGSWLALLPTAHGAIAMGDLVLRDTELTPVLSALQDAGIEQSAIHHHLVRETPRVLYVHLHAHGDAARIAEGVRAALALTGTPAPGSPPAAAAALDLDTAAIAMTLGHRGVVNGGVYQIGVPRPETLRDGGVPIPAAMGLGTVINFQPTGGGNAAITGDFVLLGSEVNPVLRTLRRHGIEVTSLHNHLLADDPRLFFLHFWAHRDVPALARGLRAALDSTAAR